MKGSTAMKSSHVQASTLFLIAIACSLVAGAATTKAGGYESTSSTPLNGNTRLYVWRAADFGTFIALNLYIDGVKLTTLGRNEGYEAIVRPGKHVLSISTTPCPYGQTRFTYQHVNMRRGETYSFTATWEYADWATLETSDPNRPYYALR
jgi:hypothetical protein